MMYKVKAAILLADGFEEIEALGVVDILRRANIDIDTVSVQEGFDVTSSREICVKADKLFVNMDQYDMIILPGGAGAWKLREDPRVIELVQKYDRANKMIAAICAAPMVLGKAGVVKGKKVTSYPGEEIESYLKEATYVNERVVTDGNITTSRGPFTAFDFGYALVERLGKDPADLKEGMLYNMFTK